MYLMVKNGSFIKSAFLIDKKSDLIGLRNDKL